MPWASVQQARWGHSPAGVRALGGRAKVAEYDAATPKGSLPRYAAKKSNMRRIAEMRASRKDHAGHSKRTVQARRAARGRRGQ